jgi:hypothetical protein
MHLSAPSMVAKLEGKSEMSILTEKMKLTEQNRNRSRYPLHDA